MNSACSHVSANQLVAPADAGHNRALGRAVASRLASRLLRRRRERAHNTPLLELLDGPVLRAQCPTAMW
jgi:hypothetical protein